MSETRHDPETRIHHLRKHVQRNHQLEKSEGATQNVQPKRMKWVLTQSHLDHAVTSRSVYPVFWMGSRRTCCRQGRPELGLRIPQRVQEFPEVIGKQSVDVIVGPSGSLCLRNESTKVSWSGQWPSPTPHRRATRGAHRGCPCAAVETGDRGFDSAGAGGIQDKIVEQMVGGLPALAATGESAAGL